MNTKEDNRDSLKKMDKRAFLIGALAIFGVFFIPILVTKCSVINLGVNEPNEIGDTIGGILSPFIGLISAFLVYLTFREQIKANQFLSSEINRKDYERYELIISNKIKTEFDTLFEEINNYSPFGINLLWTDNDHKKKGDAYLKNHIWKNGGFANNVRLISTLILDEISQLLHYNINFRSVQSYIISLNILLERAHNEIKYQKYLKKEIEYHFSNILNYFDFNSIYLTEIDKLDNMEDSRQLFHLRQIVKFLRLYENLKTDFDEELKNNFEEVFFKRHLINPNLDLAISRRIEILEKKK